MIPQTWDKAWHPKVLQINTSLGCSQYRCPSQGRMGREFSLLVPGLKESALCIQDLFSSMARKVVEKPGIALLLLFSSSVRLKQNWFPFGWFSVSHSQWGGAGTKKSSAQLPVDFTDLSATGIKAVCASLEAELSSWSSWKQLQGVDVVLGLKGRTEEPAGDCACCGADMGGRAAWVSFLPSIQFKRESNEGSNVCCKHMGFTKALSGWQFLLSPFPVEWLLVETGAEHICMILSTLSPSSQCLLTLVTEHPNSGSPTPLHPVPFKALFPWGKPLITHSGTWLEVCYWAAVQTSVSPLKEVLTHFY